MDITNVSIKERGFALKTYAQHSSQHCELAIRLLRMAGAGVFEEKLETLKQSFREVRSNADLLYRKRVSQLQSPASADFVMLRNITANFNRLTIELIEELTRIAALAIETEWGLFFEHMASEQKEMLENTYTLNLA